ncbi:MAG: hypothetical protein SFU85_04220 [Candidatus Methylacidiphilales bacterium]|nr:hypothetical protein [Candidatus Methylacidiphilales bacterium]
MTEPVKTRRLGPRWSAKSDDFITALAWSPDAAKLAVANGAGGIDLFAGDGSLIEKIQAHDLGVQSLTWSPDGALFFSAAQDGRLRSWTAEGGKGAVDLKPAKGWPLRMLWSTGPESPLMAVAWGKSVVLTGKDGVPLRDITDGKTSIEDLAWYPPGGMLLGATHGGLRVWDPKSGREIRRYDWPAALWSCTWSPDGRWVTAGSQEHSVHIWEAASGDHLHMQGYPGKVRLQSWTADSKWLATAGGMDIILWDCSGPGPDGRQGKPFMAHADLVTAMAFHPRNHHLVSGCKAGRLILWNGDGEDEILGAAVLDQEISTLAWSPVQDRIAVGTAQGSVAVF